MHTNHLSTREACYKFCIGDHETVALWERIYYKEGREALYIERRRGKRKNMTSKTKPKQPKIDQRTDVDLLAENEYLRAEVAYLKKLNALVQERIQREKGKK